MPNQMLITSFFAASVDDRVEFVHVHHNDPQAAVRALQGHGRTAAAAPHPDGMDHALRKAIKHGGFTFRDAVGDGPTHGFMVATDKHTEHRVPRSELTPEHISDYSSIHQHTLKQPDHYLGGWSHRGKVYLDISRHVTNRDEAMDLARKHRQIAIYDLGKGESVDTEPAHKSDYDRTASLHTASETYPYMRNNDGMRHVQGYGQEHEPWGKYMSHDAHGTAPEGYETGSVTFTNPLHVDHADGGWKQTLSEAYGGATGKDLTRALQGAGHDGVVTHDGRYGIGEMVGLHTHGKTAGASADHPIKNVPMKDLPVRDDLGRGQHVDHPHSISGEDDPRMYQGLFPAGSTFSLHHRPLEELNPPGKIHHGKGGRHDADCYDAQHVDDMRHDNGSEDDFNDANYVRSMAKKPHTLPALVGNEDEHGRANYFGGGHRTAAWAEAGWTHAPIWLADKTKTASLVHLASGVEQPTVAALVSGQVVGFISWGPRNHQVERLWVQPEHRRRGVATAMMAEASRIVPDLSHGPERTEDGEAWAQKVGGTTPPRTHASVDAAEVCLPILAHLQRVLASTDQTEGLDAHVPPMTDEELAAGYEHHHDFLPHGKVFAPTKGSLDPVLFRPNHKMVPDVRRVIFDRIDGCLSPRGYHDWRDWSVISLTGSEASEWWGNHDFDTMFGIDYAGYKTAHPDDSDLTGDEISDKVTDLFRKDFNDEEWVAPWDGEVWHLTCFSNPGAYDVRDIQPYAAYDMTHDDWAVKPVEVSADWGPEKWPEATWDMLDAYLLLIKAIGELPHPEQERQGANLYDWLHGDRRRAFSDHGTGWADIGNVIWKALDLDPSEPLTKLVEWKHDENADPGETTQNRPWYDEACDHPMHGGDTSHTAAKSMSWDEVKAKHPVYQDGGFDHSVNELANSHPEYNGEMRTQRLRFTEENVNHRDVKFQRYPASDPRVKSILQGHKEGATIPPVLLVNRAGQLHKADGDHRLSAAEILDQPVPAVIAHSPRDDEYTGRASAGYVSRNRRTKTAYSGGHEREGHLQGGHAGRGGDAGDRRVRQGDAGPRERRVGSRLRRALGVGDGPHPGPLTWHSKARKEYSKLDKPSQRSVQSTIEALQRGDDNLQTHDLRKPLDGWYGTKASRGHRIVHRRNDESGLHVGAISLHDYGDAERRLGMLIPPIS